MSLTVLCDPVSYWKLRAVMGDIDAMSAQIQQRQHALQQLLVRQAEILRAVVGDDVDLNFVSKLTWQDDTLEITLDGAVRLDDVATT